MTKRSDESAKPFRTTHRRLVKLFQHTELMQFLVAALILLVACCCATDNSISNSFSGLYRPSLRFRPDDAAGAFLIKKHRFENTILPKINTTSHDQRVHTRESALNSIFRLGCQTCLNFQTRDFLDFFVEPLTITMQQLEPNQHKVSSFMTKRVKSTTNHLQSIATQYNRDDIQLNQTMAVLVFNGDPTLRVSCRMKVIFFQATFWSVRRYYQHITILTKGAQDHATVLEMQLPLATVVNLDLKFNNTLLSGMKASTATSLVHGKLIAKSLDWVAESWAAGGSWAQFQHLYFSVGDQVLHARRLPNLYDALDASLESNFLIAPHRMQTLPLAQSVPPQLRDKLWPAPALNSSAGASTASEFNRTRSSQWQPGAHITTEPLARLTGSCCDEGRILFPSCPRATTQDANTFDTGKNTSTARSSPQHWASCTEFGARNFTNWLRVGPDGFAIPPVTVHLAHCSYSSTPRQCPLPPGLSQADASALCSRVPRPEKSISGRQMMREAERTAYSYCFESPTVRYDPLTAHLLDHADAKELQAPRTSKFTV